MSSKGKCFGVHYRLHLIKLGAQLQSGSLFGGPCHRQQLAFVKSSVWIQGQLILPFSNGYGHAGKACKRSDIREGFTITSIRFSFCKTRLFSGY